ncbi:respiratory nitrate reductase chaperone NarJ [Saccharopolyspora kobensis]|uniref:Respiratory nitrate reductase chaperone NarJ n=1 Tax=Saccharopolyspora kobensis TaxID=146035 RepID=A0A1H6CYK8_9PSEU|nr:nitrate reductase molybdenum cofactor assembly chaperone [Saccharopolyspora kobensis]SEG77803.1 respiratory nitrate reductase chaperone NarJ [Saccharopolyspora kobensis]SFD03592.1 respiratory nitrate reductase chaperone NarJ [Saccharopolyspora kobensis]
MTFDRARALTHRIAAFLLAYPDEELLERLPLLREGCAELPAAQRDPLLELVRHLETASLLAAQQHYVETFDLRRRCCQYLSYWTAGDTRNRGRAIVDFKSIYRAAGVLPPVDELPDHLTVVLEFAATTDQERGTALLVDHHAGLTLLAAALRDQGTVYAHGVEAVLTTLPAPTPEALRSAKRIAATGPPQESVGMAGPLQPFGGPR